MENTITTETTDNALESMGSKATPDSEIAISVKHSIPMATERAKIPMTVKVDDDGRARFAAPSVLTKADARKLREKDPEAFTPTIEGLIKVAQAVDPAMADRLRAKGELVASFVRDEYADKTGQNVVTSEGEVSESEIARLTNKAVTRQIKRIAKGQLSRENAKTEDEIEASVRKSALNKAITIEHAAKKHQTLAMTAELCNGLADTLRAAKKARKAAMSAGRKLTDDERDAVNVGLQGREVAQALAEQAGLIASENNEA